MSLSQSWFEMQDLRKCKLDLSVWIPLRSEKSIESAFKQNFAGYKEEFLGAGLALHPHRIYLYVSASGSTLHSIGIL